MLLLLTPAARCGRLAAYQRTMNSRTSMVAVNIEVAMPSVIVTAKPRTGPAPKKNSMTWARKAVALLSMMVAKARRNPVSMAFSGVRPLRTSSRMRSLIRMLASTAMPSVSRMPAMPGSVSVASNRLSRAISSTRLASRAMLANQPNSP